MIHRCIVSLTGILLVMVAAAFGSDPPSLTEQQDVMKASQAWLDAFNHRDLQAFASYIADDYIGTTDDGVLTTKDRLVKWLSKKKAAYVQRSNMHDAQVRMDGDTAIVNYLITSKNVWGDTTIVLYLRRTEVFKKKNQKWLVIATHENPLPANFFKAIEIDSMVLKDYLGEYDWPRHEDEDIDKISIENGRLVSLWRGTKQEYQPMAKDTFFSRDDVGWLRFVRDEQGRVTSYIYSYPDGQEVCANKIR